MKNLLYFLLFLAVSCSKQEVANNSTGIADDTKQLTKAENRLVGSWKFFKTEDANVMGVADYIAYPELQFKANLLGLEHANYIFPVPEEEKIRSFSYTLEAPLVLTLKYENEAQKYKVAFRENDDVLVLTYENKETGSIFSKFYSRVK